MTLKWKRTSNILYVNGSKEIEVSNIVRNELNKLRKSDQVVETIPDGLPYYPRQFPVGLWSIGYPIPKDESDDYLYPYFIPTDAWQLVDVWSTNNGKYCQKTGAKIKDYGYGIHFSESNTTLGCLKVINKSDIFWLVGMIQEELGNKLPVTIEVIE
jgi:hypothetical protein